MNEQSNYKYIIHIDGNVNAYRLLTTMTTGSLILRVTSQYTSWVDHLLQHKVHYIPVKADLSDLLDVVRWCKQNDDRCREIASNGMKMAQTILSKKFIQTYFQKVLFSVPASVQVQMPALAKKSVKKSSPTRKSSPKVKSRAKTMKVRMTKEERQVEKERKEADKQRKEADKQQKEADKLAEKERKEAEKQQKEADKLAEKQQKEADKLAEKERKEAEKQQKEVDKQAEKQRKEAEKLAKKAAKTTT